MLAVLLGSGSPSPLSLQLSWDPSGRWNVTRRWVWSTPTNKKCSVRNSSVLFQKWPKVKKKTKKTTTTQKQNKTKNPGNKDLQQRDVGEYQLRSTFTQLLYFVLLYIHSTTSCRHILYFYSAIYLKSVVTIYYSR